MVWVRIRRGVYYFIRMCQYTCNLCLTLWLSCHTWIWMANVRPKNVFCTKFRGWKVTLSTAIRNWHIIVRSVLYSSKWMIFFHSKLSSLLASTCDDSFNSRNSCVLKISRKIWADLTFSVYRNAKERMDNSKAAKWNAKKFFIVKHLLWLFL